MSAATISRLTVRPISGGGDFPQPKSRLLSRRGKLARAAAPKAVDRLIELIDSADERVAAVACNAILDRAFGKPGPVKEEKDDFKARLGNMTREERLALMQTMLERVRQYLPAAPKQRRLSSQSAR
jgi:hypothetical protein